MGRQRRKYQAAKPLYLANALRTTRSTWQNRISLVNLCTLSEGWIDFSEGDAKKIAKGANNIRRRSRICLPTR